MTPLTNAELQAAINAYIELLKIEVNAPSTREEMLQSLQMEQVRRAQLDARFSGEAIFDKGLYKDYGKSNPYGVTIAPL